MVVILLTGCISVARMSDFPQSARDINFDHYSKLYNSVEAQSWDFESSNEYYLETRKKIDEEKLHSLVIQTFADNSYELKRYVAVERFFAGLRGLSLNEWTTIVYLYYNYKADSTLQIYIDSKYTQDFTGDIRENRAKKIGLTLIRYIENIK